MDNERGLRFADEMHKEFFVEQSQKLKPDVYLRSLVYSLGMCHDTRRNFDVIYDVKGRCINTEAVREAWQTGSSLKVTRLAFQLFTDTTPTAFAGGCHDIDECRRYSVSDIFCCGYAPYFVEAIHLRYPEYLRSGYRKSNMTTIVEVI